MRSFRTATDWSKVSKQFNLLVTVKPLIFIVFLDPPQNFHEVAYFADDRQDLLNGINEFLDCSIVIPPSDVEGKDLLKTVASFQKQMLRKRKEREYKKCGSTVTGADLETKGEILFSFVIYIFQFVCSVNVDLYSLCYRREYG